ncbi:MAG: tRNA (cytidine(34)-2'-O)-methyltransferase [Hyphomicrobiales bacterium]|nr:tRNA (cytidine(34)-2'-O)-methyltransferase [Hyphomicrobiales bacterium]
MPDLVLYQPDIPGNTGTLMRLAACLDFHIHIIQPAGFRLDDTNLKRAGMDYLELARLVRHSHWQNFEAWRNGESRRLLLLTTSGSESHLEIKYRQNDLIMLGRESSGVPDFVHNAANHSILIPMHKQARSINIALSGAMVMGEALRQTDKFP